MEVVPVCVINRADQRTSDLVERTGALRQLSVCAAKQTNRAQGSVASFLTPVLSLPHAAKSLAARRRC